MKNSPPELPIIQMTYDLILWYIPILNRLPRDHKFMLGDRLITRLYNLLDELILARYAREKLARLEALNGELDLIRYQTRLLKDFTLIDARRYGHASKLINNIGQSLGGSNNKRDGRDETALRPLASSDRLHQSDHGCPTGPAWQTIPRQRTGLQLQCDVRKYFPSIDHLILKQMLRRKIKCLDTLWLADAIIDASNPQEPVADYFAGAAW